MQHLADWDAVPVLCVIFVVRVSHQGMLRQYCVPFETSWKNCARHKPSERTPTMLLATITWCCLLDRQREGVVVLKLDALQATSANLDFVVSLCRFVRRHVLHVLDICGHLESSTFSDPVARGQGMHRAANTSAGTLSLLVVCMTV